ncbi:MAG: periplasmic heavy metal sensor [Syntrophobacteraceae bacterium]|nr:periplasmic heavy metal sensor [Syntrophobacteraceae bacterium]
MNTAKGKRTTLGIISVVALLLVGASVLHAHFRPLRGMDCYTPEERAEKIRERISRQLDLNDSQQKQLEGIVEDLMEKGQALRALRATSHQEILKILRSDTVDAKRIEHLASEHQERINELISTVSRSLTEFLRVLSPEQRERLAKALEDHFAWFGPLAH